MLKDVSFSPQEYRLSPWRQVIIELIQNLAVRYGPRGLSRLVWLGRRLLIGTGMRVIRYRDRFLVLCDSNSRYGVMRASGFIHRAHDRLLSTVLSDIHEDVVLMDVGANEGFVSLLACSAFEDHRRVYAHCFEPNPTAFQMLSLNASLNSFHMILNDFALGESSCFGTLTLSTKTSNSTMVPGGLPYISISGQEQVRVETLDAYCSRHALLPNVIKIDVEGYEPYVLKASSYVLEKASPYLIVEINPRALSAGGNSAKGLLDLLADLDYRLFHVDYGRVGLSTEQVSKRERWSGYVEVHPADAELGHFFDVLAVPRKSMTL